VYLEHAAFRQSLVNTSSYLDDDGDVENIDAVDDSLSEPLPGQADRRRLEEDHVLRVLFDVVLEVGSATDREETAERYIEGLIESIDDGSLEDALHYFGNATNLSDASIHREKSKQWIEDETIVQYTTVVYKVIPAPSPAPTAAHWEPGGPQYGDKKEGKTSPSTAVSVEIGVLIGLIVALVVGSCFTGALVLRYIKTNRRCWYSHDRGAALDRSIDNLTLTINLSEAGHREEMIDLIPAGDGDAKYAEDDDGHVPGQLKTSETYQVRARYRSVEWCDESRTGKVVWLCGEKHGQRFVRRFSDEVPASAESLARLDLVPADTGVTLTWLPPMDKLREDLERTMAIDFKERAETFRQHADKLRVHWTVGRVEFSVRRSHLFEDAYAAIGNLPADHWRRPFFITFAGEAGLDAGGLSREFFWQCSLEAFDAAAGYFKNCHGTYQYQLCDDEDDGSVGAPRRREKMLVFIGRLMAKAILEAHHIAAHPSLILLKHICCEPIALDDLQLVDFELWKSLSMLPQMAPNVIESLDIAFVVSAVRNGECVTTELGPGGASRTVTAENVAEFLELRLKQRVLDVCRNGLGALLHGVYSVVPLEILLLLSARELELTLCGVPRISVDEWRAATIYHGVFADLGDRHPVIERFWTVVASWDNQQRAMLLQWATGSSRVPAQGFGYLHGRDGALRSFTITSVEVSQAIYPRSHTCFNRIDLPLYRTEDELREAFDFVLSNAAAHAMFSID